METQEHNLPNGKRYLSKRTGIPIKWDYNGNATGGIEMLVWQKEKWLYITSCETEKDVETFLKLVGRNKTN